MGALAEQADRAVTYARKHLHKYSQEAEYFEELVQLMGLVAYSKEQRKNLKQFSKFSKCDDLAELFRREAFMVYSLPNDSPLI